MAGGEVAADWGGGGGDSLMVRGFGGFGRWRLEVASGWRWRRLASPVGQGWTSGRRQQRGQAGARVLGGRVCHGRQPAEECRRGVKTPFRVYVSQVCKRVRELNVWA